eukprot:2371108-Prymnesium_polylepis.3
MAVALHRLPVDPDLVRSLVASLRPPSATDERVAVLFKQIDHGRAWCLDREHRDAMGLPRKASQHKLLGALHLYGARQQTEKRSVPFRLRQWRRKRWYGWGQGRLAAHV